ncbi:conserved hypothetical protein [Ricinus communis]|uniref:Uncharacterized protein n=1 Tax=Ricinus communis TaxID=3988 RepID=B9SPB4_RICCO|nr:conserved hypothetical protein [Ricinus communis]
MQRTVTLKDNITCCRNRQQKNLHPRFSKVHEVHNSVSPSLQITLGSNATESKLILLLSQDILLMDSITCRLSSYLEQQWKKEDY